MSRAGFLQTWCLELRFIRPENLVSHSLFSCVFTEERIESCHTAIKPRSVECCRDVCPSVDFSYLHIWSWSSSRVTIRLLVTTLTKALLHQLLSLARRFIFQQDNDPKHTARVAYRQLCECSWVAQPQPGIEPNQIFLEKPENVCLPPSNLTELERWRGEEKNGR